MTDYYHFPSPDPKGQKKPRQLSKRRTQRMSLYIDGTNLFAGQYELFGPKRVLYFGSLLKDIRTYYPVTNIFFYASYTPKFPSRKPKDFYAAEALFYREVRVTKGMYFYKGHRSPASGKEKGVDVHLALDMLRDAFQRNYDEAVIMTGDADLMYPVELVQSLNLPVHALFLPNRFSLEIAYKANSAVVLNYQKRFVGKRKMPVNLRVIPIKSPTCKQVG